jgi:hypothetical protein
MNKIIFVAYKEYLRIAYKKAILYIITFATFIVIANLVFLKSRYIYMSSFVLDAVSLLIYFKYYIVKQRIDNNVFGGNYRESIDILKFLLKKSDYIDFDVPAKENVPKRTSLSVDEV